VKIIGDLRNTGNMKKLYTLRYIILLLILNTVIQQAYHLNQWYGDTGL